MSNEIGHNYPTGATLYACRFVLDGDVFITSGASSETWGDSGHDADDYDVTLTESGASGHYVGDFDASSNISEGTYRVCVYLQAGANPADADIAIAQGILHWDGSSGIDNYTINSDLVTIKSDIEVIQSDLVVVDSNMDAAMSDLVVMDSNIDSIQSDLTIMASDLAVSISDVGHLTILDGVQYNDFQFPLGGLFKSTSFFG